MDEEANVAPAGDDESAAVSNDMPASLSLEDAAAQLDAAEAERSEEANPTEVSADAAQGGDDDTTEEPEGAEEEHEPADDDTEAAAEDDEADDSNDDDTVELDRLHGNTQIRLKHGQVWTVAEMKRRLEAVENIDAAQANFQRQAQEFQAYAEKISQSNQQLTKLAPLAVKALQERIPELPPKPTRADFEADRFDYEEKLVTYNEALDQKAAREAEIAQLTEAQTREAQQTQAQQAQAYEQAYQQHIQTQRQELVRLFPELKDEKKRVEFGQGFVEDGRSLGFSDDEISQTHDPRLMAAVRKAAAYDRLQANPAKPVKTMPRTAVQKPGQRQNGAQAKVAKAEQLTAQAHAANGDLEALARIAEQMGI